jgi:hypothetical protein
MKSNTLHKTQLYKIYPGKKCPLKFKAFKIKANSPSIALSKYLLMHEEFGGKNWILEKDDFEGWFLFQVVFTDQNRNLTKIYDFDVSIVGRY